MGTEFWAEVYTKKSMERPAHILDLIDEKWLAPADGSEGAPGEHISPRLPSLMLEQDNPRHRVLPDGLVQSPKVEVVSSSVRPSHGLISSGARVNDDVVARTYPLSWKPIGWVSSWP